MTTPPFRKILVANRGEIAVRIFRAATELGMATVAVYSHEDRHSIHRYKADQAFRVGTPGQPVAAYLDIEGILAVATSEGVEAIHPGYGFLSENADLAAGCAERGIAFVGPPAEVIARMGDKTRARELAHEAGVPVVPGMEEATESVEDVRAFASGSRFPIMLKAAHGGGGRGMRIVRAEADLDAEFAAATREARAAFGRGEVFAERFVEHPKHVEVQVLADAHGGLVHLHERDCSIQRRHQKIVELAPAVSLSREVADRLHRHALAIAERAGYVNAGTVEFLVAGDEVFFLEVNPRIQVEHTVTEIVTGIDLVSAQFHVAAGRRLSDPEIGIVSQSSIAVHGVAVQCRLTTEDPRKNFTPDTGRIRVYRSVGGFGIRLDAGVGGAGSVITPHYDSMVVKITTWSDRLATAAAKMRRALLEFRIRGVKTNIPFLQNVIDHPEFRAGNATTTFVEETPELFDFGRRRDRGSRTLKGIAEIIVNGPPTMAGRPVRPAPLIEPTVPRLVAGVDTAPARVGEPMRLLTEEGPEALSRWIRDHDRVLVTDTTFRDAHQSLLATRVRTADLVAIAPATARIAPDLFSHEMWGGATFDVAYRFLKEDPWERLVEMRRALPNVCFQMLLRGANAVGYGRYPDAVVRAFIAESAAAGIDVFRIFDALNYLPNMELSIEEVLKSGKVCEAAICYTADVRTSTKYDLAYYVGLAIELEKRGAHILAIKDMAGLLKPRSARVLIEGLRDAVELPIHLHTHDTSGNGVATYLAACEAGVDIVDCALSSMAGLTSQPSMNALVAALEGDPRAPEIDPAGIGRLASYWERVRDLYHPFESGLKAGTAEVYVHEIPGGQYSNLRPRAIQLGLGDHWDTVLARYTEVDRALGGLIKVTPSSKMVADFALFLVQNEMTVDDVLAAGAAGKQLDLPRSVVEFFQGGLGMPHGGFPEDLRRAVLVGHDETCPAPPEGDLPAPSDALKSALDREPTHRDVLSEALYPQVYREYVDTRSRSGDMSRLPTSVFLYGLEPNEETEVEIERGKTLIVTLLAVGDVQADGRREVYFELNGQLREVSVVDHAAEPAKGGRAQADPANAGHVGATMRGKVVAVLVKAGEAVTLGQRLVVTEAMKVETAVGAAAAGTVASVEVSEGDAVERGDLLVVVEVSG